ncbi:Methyl-accepting chemotaxis protein III (ribose and galactose chemoreceptor protein) [Cronobacter malonaticus 507]|nr:Methyl-accepting chemotaxis protein III (ribose and galactose chemoreceptor protein) [Cronobacter malonaticus 507]
MKQNADNAHHASKLAQDASGKATTGGQIVSGVVTTMGNISSSSKKISEITAVINSIAFQTNILALKYRGRSGACGRTGPWLRGRGQRSAHAGEPQRPGGERD